MRTAVAVISVVSALLLASGCEDPFPPDEPDPEATIKCPEEAEACAVYDYGWEAQCTYGSVETRDLTQTGYCAPGKHEELCRSEQHGWQIVHTCSGQCSDEIKYFETYTEWSGFDPASLCL